MPHVIATRPLDLSPDETIEYRPADHLPNIVTALFRCTITLRNGCMYTYRVRARCGLEAAAKCLRELHAMQVREVGRLVNLNTWLLTEVQSETTHQIPGSIRVS